MTSVKDTFEGWDFIYTSFCLGPTLRFRLIAGLPLLNAAAVSGMQMEC